VRPPARATDVDAILGTRGLLLYLLSLSAVANALLAAFPPGPRRAASLAAWAGLLALAQLAGDALAPRLAGIERARRTRLRIVGSVAYAGLAAMALLLAFGAPTPRLLQTLVSLLAWIHALLLLAAGLSREALAPLVNSLVLVLLAAVPGGLVAAVAATAYAALLAAFLVFDTFARKLTFYPVPAGRWHGAAVRQALSVALPTALGMALLLAASPPRPSALALREAFEDPLAREANLAAYRLIVFFGLIGAAAIHLAGRVFGPRKRKPRTQELVLPERGTDELLPGASPPARVLYPGARGRIVRAYVAFLARAARLGWRRRPEQTPSEFAAQVREPSSPLAALTELFVRARYGPEEPSDADASAAEEAAEAVVGALRRLRRA
jgi:hypothetical protein